MSIARINPTKSCATWNPAEGFLTADVDDLAAMFGISHEAATLIRQATEPGDTVLDVLNKLSATK